MSVTAKEILQLARNLSAAASSEVEHRNIVGRAYYAAYHLAHSFHSQLPSSGDTPPRVLGVHGELTYRLDHPTIAAGDPRYRQSKLLGLKLRPFMVLRTRADYNLHESIPKADAADALIKAAAIFKIVGES